ncbi:type I restriction enzyme S subunit [Chromohalobacter marismortui]|uniref:Type I restriction enzyme S subunit n=1 Tax=Chromohalobacter marismortui TaxID=42055 RepID=A0A4R7NRC7_9GAMM|nr:restriction endonuclease subunit S [Chromohalobacter marismortui]TDU23534.1 type I restriction enzyme S subunit [Chromohalobacter marismortui]
MSAQQLITDHLDLWTGAVTHKSGSGRSASGKNGKIELTGIKKLRELILELAVRGKLVEQDPSDEPASVLLERIAEEKTRLVKEGKIKKPKKLPHVSEKDKYFQTPKKWEWVRLGNLFNSIMSGGTPNKSNPEFWGGKIPWASVKDLGKSKNIEKTIDYITAEGLKAGSKLADSGDILICTRMGLGKVAICSRPVAINQDIKAVKLSSGTSIDFFLIAYKALDIIGTGTTVSGITQDKLLNYVIGLPPLEEQHRIVKKVDELMALCDQLEQEVSDQLKAHEVLVDTLLDALTRSSDATELAENWARVSEHFDTLFTTEASIDKLKKTILQLAVMGRLVEQDPNDEPASALLDEILAERDRLKREEGMKTKASGAVNTEEAYLTIPRSWVWVRLGNTAKFIDYRGKTPKKLGSGKRLITAKNIRKGYIDKDPEEFISEPYYHTWMTRGFPRVGDTLFTPEAPLGNAANVDLEEEFALAQRAICFQWHVKEISPFMLMQILALPFQEQLIFNATGMTANGIKAAKLKEIPVVLPPLEEQKSIVEKVDELMALCDRLKARLSEAGETRYQLAETVVEQAVS